MTLFPHTKNWKEISVSSDLEAPLKNLAEHLFGQSHILTANSDVGSWSLACMSGFSPVSQYDLLINLSGEDLKLPDRMFCLAGSGAEFHGQRQRAWIAEPGNIHLSVYFRPNCQIENFAVAFPILAAVSVVEAIDGISGLEGRAGIKWVNDILVNHGKVAGFITHIQSMEKVVKTAILGVGLNVEKTPQVLRDDYVPMVTCLKEQARDATQCSQPRILLSLLDRLERNYETLLYKGCASLLDIYRQRSLVLGRNVQVFLEPEETKPQKIAAGRVVAIGEELELYLEGQTKPVNRGRLVLEF